MLDVNCLLTRILINHFNVFYKILFHKYVLTRKNKDQIHVYPLVNLGILKSLVYFYDQRGSNKFYLKKKQVGLTYENNSVLRQSLGTGEGMFKITGSCYQKIIHNGTRVQDVSSSYTCSLSFLHFV